ncbi:DNA-binding transcriptional regulator, GntR family [Salinibacillus kushneri]|uniref:DNA-binding transcriptional regulator, GntR family n=1 Tax=Salinibacillus kushneri TaxID=237682 RepID=A0A1I0C8M1_9BACI|nr:DNA-binding transcriptional regulator, GntR family [Salinibacillus kushneri]
MYEELREQIIMLKLHPGRSISENEMSTTLEVSRTPIREAFLRLAQEKLLEIYPQKGTFVALIDLDYVEEARFIREHLERAIIKEACKSFDSNSLEKLENNFEQQKNAVEKKDHTKFFELDEEFHQTISIGADKERIWSIIQQMNAHLNRIRMLSLRANYNYELILDQHEEMINAIKTQNDIKADHVMEEHTKKLTFEQEGLKKEFPDYFR